MKKTFIHESSFVDESAKIGMSSFIWHFCHIMKDVTIGKSCTLGQNTFIASGVNIGNSVKIQNNVSIYKGVEVMDEVFIGPSVVFTNVINPRSIIDRKDEFKPTLIDIGASIGANSTIVCGNSIGAYAMIGAGAVIVGNVAPYALVVGNPAEQIGWVSQAGIRLTFDSDNVAICKHTNQEYRLDNGSVSVIE